VPKVPIRDLKSNFSSSGLGKKKVLVEADVPWVAVCVRVVSERGNSLFSVQTEEKRRFHHAAKKGKAIT
jgi:hypothetical protein